MTMPSTLLFDYGGTLDTAAVHWNFILLEAYHHQGLHEVDGEAWREAYVFGERALARSPLILPTDDFFSLLLKKVKLELHWLLTHRQVNLPLLHGEIHTDVSLSAAVYPAAVPALSGEAAAMAEAEDLLIVVDTHRPSMVQCPELLGICEKVVVIDHHRKVEEFIENPVLAYMESYASSTSELVAEILQYMTTKKVLLKLEAEALLAGITVDTNGFAMKTGVRTFEAAAWLRRQGADPTEVKRFFQEDLYNIRLKAAAISATEILGGDIAITTCQQVMPDAQLICAQVADQLLTIKGVKASFVVGRNNEMKTVISARSMGEINVQVIMEKFGGGGHLTTAAAQVDSSIDETVEKIMNVLEANKQ